MEINATGKLKYKDESTGSELALYVSFKLPNRLFKVRRRKVLCDSWWVGIEEGYKSFDEFQDDVIYYLKDESHVKGLIVEMVKEYINREAKDLTREDKEKLIKQLSGNKRNFEVTVRI